MTFQLFNVKNKSEWHEILMPSLKLLFSNKTEILSQVDRGKVYHIDFENKTIAYHDDKGNIIHHDYTAICLIDDEGNRLQHKTEFLTQLHNHLFLN